MLSATPLYVSVSGRFSTTDVSGPLVSPDGAFSIRFVVDSNPTPITGTVTTLGFNPPTSDFHYTLDGAETVISPSEIRFNTLENGGLFDVTFGSGITASQFSFAGVQAFSGAPATPAFTPGQYGVSSWTFSDPANFDAQDLTGASVAMTPTPEPSSLAIVAAGSLGLLCFMRRTAETSGR